MICEAENAKAKTAVPAAIITTARLLPSASLFQKGIAAAKITGHTIEVIVSQRQGNCVCCSGRNRVQIGRETGVAIIIVSRTTTPIAFKSLRLWVEFSQAWGRADFHISGSAGQNIATVASNRKFIHQTLR